MNLSMTIVEITGGMLRAARSLTGLSQQEQSALQSRVLASRLGKARAATSLMPKRARCIVLSRRSRPKASASLTAACICSAPAPIAGLLTGFEQVCATTAKAMLLHVLKARLEKVPNSLRLSGLSRWVRNFDWIAQYSP
jgi:hypothetical protein